MSQQSDEAFVTLTGLKKRYRDVVAVDDVSFHIARGEIFGYIGPNGAGKTTTIKIMVGLLTEFEGEVTIAGRSMPAEKGEIHKLLGYLPQQVAFQEWRTVDHALQSFGRLSGMGGAELEQQIETVLNQLDLTPVRYKKIGQLSGGNAQRVSLAQALLHSPQLLVLDEPLAGLDPTSRHRVKQVIRRLGREGTTILFSSHILSDVQDVAGRIAILNNGRLVHVGTMDELTRTLRLTDEVEVGLSYDSGGWQALSDLPGIRRIEATEPLKLRVFLEENASRDDTLHQLTVGLIESGCRLRSLQPVSRSLDEVYLRSLNGGSPEATGVEQDGLKEMIVNE